MADIWKLWRNSRVMWHYNFLQRTSKETYFDGARLLSLPPPPSPPLTGQNRVKQPVAVKNGIFRATGLLSQVLGFSLKRLWRQLRSQFLHIFISSEFQCIELTQTLVCQSGQRATLRKKKDSTSRRPEVNGWQVSHINRSNWLAYPSAHAQSHFSSGIVAPKYPKDTFTTMKTKQ